jgi:transmembrane sensor
MAGNQTIEAAAAAWFARRDSGEWQEADQAALDAWLSASVAHRIAFIRVEAAWKRADRLKALGAGVKAGSAPPTGVWRFAQLLEGGRPALAPASASPWRRHIALVQWMRGLAAILIIALAGATTLYVFGARASEYRTAVGGLETVPLADGSTITLNTDSEIRVALNKSARTIELEHGEAFFEVAKDPGRPFVVDVGDRRVIAVGTKFSVRRDGDEIRVAVAEGHVRVEAGDAAGQPPTHLQPGDIANADRDSLLVKQKPLAELEAEDLGWRSGYVAFRDTPLGEVVKEFNRYNVAKISVTDAEVAAIRIGGSFRVANVDAFLRLIEQGISVHAVRERGQIILKRD